jgi:hypothetical protein
MSSDTPHEPSPQGDPRSIRLTLVYDESGVRVIDRTPVPKPAPPSVEDVPTFTAARPGEPELPSHAVVTELRDAGDETMYRQIVEHAIPQDVEVFEPGVERGARRHPQPLPSGVFTVIVPDDERAQAVVLLAGPGSRGAERGLQVGAIGGPVELTRFSLRGNGNG